MTIGILSVDKQDFRNSVEDYYKGLNLQMTNDNGYALLDIYIRPIITDQDAELCYDKVIIGKELTHKIEQFAKVKKSCKIG